MAYLASEAQFTYWGALSFSLLLLNPYPLPQQTFAKQVPLLSANADTQGHYIPTFTLVFWW